MTNITVETREATNARMNALSKTENRTLAIKNALNTLDYEIVFHRDANKARYTLYIRDDSKNAHRGQTLLELWARKNDKYELCTREKHENSTYHSDWNFKYNSTYDSLTDVITAIINYLESLITSAETESEKTA